MVTCRFFFPNESIIKTSDNNTFKIRVRQVILLINVKPILLLYNIKFFIQRIRTKGFTCYSGTSLLKVNMRYCANPIILRANKENGNSATHNSK